MRPRFPQHRVMIVVACLALVSTICGASPQEEGGRRATPQPRTPQVSRMSEQTSSSPRTITPHGPQTRTHETRRPNGEQRVATVYVDPGTHLVVPPAWRRCTVFPDLGYWRYRDLMAEIQWLSRKGFIPVTALGDSVEILSDYAQAPAGWRAYGLAVPPGGTIQVEVQHEKLGWFRLMLVDKWGKPGPGMLQAAIAHQPVMVTYKNPNPDEATAIYIIVDDPAWWSDAKSPYTLVVRRDWDPAKTDLSQVKMVAGLWGASPSVSAEFRGPSLSGPAVYPR